MNGISLIIPYYNEERILAASLAQIWRYLETIGRPFELILADDGSTDGSPAIAEAFRKKHADRCRIVKNPANEGKGGALTGGLSQATRPIVCFTDADMEIPTDYLSQVIKHLDGTEHAICIGSKLLTPQGAVRARHRHLASIAYNFLVRIFLHSKITDHQCGLKGFKLEALREILPLVKERGWAWDTEFLLHAQKKGYSIMEIPVELHQKRKSTVPFFSIVWLLLKKILEYRRRGLAL